MYKRKILYYMMSVFILMTFSSCGTKEATDSESKEIHTDTEKPSDKPELKGKKESLEILVKNVREGCISVESLAKTSEVKSASLEPTAESQTPAETQEPIIQEPQITELNVTMYATRDVNVRGGDNKNTSLMGFLARGQEVLVTGQSSSTGWYRIDYNGQVGFVSNKYLQSDKPAQQSDEQAQDVESPSQSAQAKQPAARSGSVRQILNNAPLNPSLSGYEPLDTLLSNLLPQLYSDSADTYEKVKACYDYLIQNCSYGSKGGSGVKKAYEMLVSHVGDCSDYSVAFDVMMKRIGLECKVIALGKTTKTDGSYTSHWWCVVTIDGVEYVFDAQVEDNIAKGGAIQYYRFCKRYDEVPGKYIVGGTYDYYPYEEEPIEDSFSWEEFYQIEDPEQLEELYQFLIEMEDNSEFESESD